MSAALGTERPDGYDSEASCGPAPSGRRDGFAAAEHVLAGAGANDGASGAAEAASRKGARRRAMAARPNPPVFVFNGLSRRRTDGEDGGAEAPGEGGTGGPNTRQGLMATMESIMVEGSRRRRRRPARAPSMTDAERAARDRALVLLTAGPNAVAARLGPTWGVPPNQPPAANSTPGSSSLRSGGPGSSSGAESASGAPQPMASRASVAQSSRQALEAINAYKARLLDAPAAARHACASLRPSAAACSATERRIERLSSTAYRCELLCHAAAAFSAARAPSAPLTPLWWHRHIGG